jgi:hypothetical protein
MIAKSSMNHPPRVPAEPPPESLNQQSSSSIKTTEDIAAATTTTSGQANDSTAQAAAMKSLNSPRQRLQIAEMVMRKLYKKNLTTEKKLALLQQDYTKLEEHVKSMESRPQDQCSSMDTTTTAGACTNCIKFSRLKEILLTNPSTGSTPDQVTKIQIQKQEYLFHLANEQDKTIVALKQRIEQLSSQLDTQSKKPSSTNRPHSASASASGTSQVIGKLQKKLLEAKEESERQKINYFRLKNEYKRILSLKTRSLSNSSSSKMEQNAAKELLRLFEKKIQQADEENLHHLTLYQQKLFEKEQENCQAFVQKKMIQAEMERIAQQVQQRDEIDTQIEVNYIQQIPNYIKFSKKFNHAFIYNYRHVCLVYLKD